ncbi:MAG: hypothetical protein JWP04_2282, partial [Belnapia sp.]|nr:hypothetical protein [Belnapia sp.]
MEWDAGAVTDTVAGGGDPALDRLAEEWIGLWQDEIAAMAADPDMAAVWRHAMAA